MDKKIGFVILHYYTIDDTIKCIESIKDKMKKCLYEIIVVDNASANGTGQQLKEKYENDSSITVIINEKNMGFSGGNNVGFEYAKNELKCDFIILLNNDTFLLQENFQQLIMKEYEKSNFAVLGPKIYLPNNEVNYRNPNLPTKKQLKKDIIHNRILLMLNRIYLAEVATKIKAKIKNNSIEKRSNNNRLENIVLHGCFLIFSPRYIDKFDGLDNRTFLYCEEELLYIRLKRNNLKSVYNPELEIFHNEDSSTNATTKNKRNKNIFVLKNLIYAQKVLYNELERNEINGR